MAKSKSKVESVARTCSHLCRQGGCYSTVKGAQGYSKWWPPPAPRSQGGRRRSASPLLGKRPSRSSACWWRRRRGSCTARTSRLKWPQTLSPTRAWPKSTNIPVTAMISRRGWLTDTLGEPLAPLGSGRVSVVAGQQAASRRHVAFVADKLHRRAHGEAAACENPVTVRHSSRILTRQNWHKTNDKYYTRARTWIKAPPPMMQRGRSHLAQIQATAWWLITVAQQQFHSFESKRVLYLFPIIICGILCLKITTFLCCFWLDSTAVLMNKLYKKTLPPHNVPAFVKRFN